jgi:hypothetical protein
MKQKFYLLLNLMCAIALVCDATHRVSTQFNNRLLWEIHTSTLFNSMDQNQDGELSLEELASAFQHRALPSTSRIFSASSLIEVNPTASPGIVQHDNAQAQRDDSNTPSAPSVPDLDAFGCHDLRICEDVINQQYVFIQAHS